MFHPRPYVGEPSSRTVLHPVGNKPASTVRLCILSIIASVSRFVSRMVSG